MTLRTSQLSDQEGGLDRLTQDWGTRASVTLYLDRCQVDTPKELVSNVWEHVRNRRSRIGTVIDFGAGDGRFAHGGRFRTYIGYEIDGKRCATAKLPPHATLLNKCAFAETRSDADLCIGNPPYVRNQDLPRGWRERVSDVLTLRTGVRLSGLANAWQYFFLLSLASTHTRGLIAIVVPYEWVSRPSSAALREYIKSQSWSVSVYRLRDETFDRVLTTSSITVIDKRRPTGQWGFFEELPRGGYRELPSAAESSAGVVRYALRSEASNEEVYAKRGLSPGTQEVLVLTEGERVRSGLRIGTDVVPCVTSLRPLAPDCEVLTDAVFREKFRLADHKCWLIRTDSELSGPLKSYLAHVSAAKYQTATCLSREHWWQFTMPETPDLLSATGFCGARPKVAVNAVGARAVGSVAGIYGVGRAKQRVLVRRLKGLKLSKRIVSHSNGLKKVEINQLNTLLKTLLKDSN
jgi:predicted RNA methylase